MTRGAKPDQATPSSGGAPAPLRNGCDCNVTLARVAAAKLRPNVERETVFKSTRYPTLRHPPAPRYFPMTRCVALAARQIIRSGARSSVARLRVVDLHSVDKSATCSVTRQWKHCEWWYTSATTKRSCSVCVSIQREAWHTREAAMVCARARTEMPFSEAAGNGKGAIRKANTTGS